MNATNDLTEREKVVLRYLKHCRTSHDIANILRISERTVKFHIANIVRKLKVANRTQALAVAVEKRLLD